MADSRASGRVLSMLPLTSKSRPTLTPAKSSRNQKWVGAGRRREFRNPARTDSLQSGPCDLGRLPKCSPGRCRKQMLATEPEPSTPPSRYPHDRQPQLLY
jgi:hypothetical protein